MVGVEAGEGDPPVGLLDSLVIVIQTWPLVLHPPGSNMPRLGPEMLGLTFHLHRPKSEC